MRLDRDSIYLPVKVDLIKGVIKRVMHDATGTSAEVEHLHKGKYVATWFREEQCQTLPSDSDRSSTSDATTDQQHT